MTESQINIPSTINDKQKIKLALDEIVGAGRFIADKKEYIKDCVATIHKEFNIPKKIITKIAKTIMDDNYWDVSNELSDFEALYEAIVETPDA